MKEKIRDEKHREFLVKYKDLYAYYRKHNLEETSKKYNMQESVVRNIIWKYFLYKCFEQDECFYIDIILDCVKTITDDEDEKKH